MKNIVLVLAASLLFACSTQQNISSSDFIGFDQKLATELGADDYGMSQYVVAFLKKSPD